MAPAGAVRVVSEGAKTTWYVCGPSRLRRPWPIDTGSKVPGQCKTLPQFLVGRNVCVSGRTGHRNYGSDYDSRGRRGVRPRSQDQGGGGVGSPSGRSRAENLTSVQRSEIARKAASKRWKKQLYANKGRRDMFRSEWRRWRDSNPRDVRRPTVLNAAAFDRSAHLQWAHHGPVLLPFTARRGPAFSCAPVVGEHARRGVDSSVHFFSLPVSLCVFCTTPRPRIKG